MQAQQVGNPTLMHLGGCYVGRENIACISMTGNQREQQAWECRKALLALAGVQCETVGLVTGSVPLIALKCRKKTRFRR